MKKDDNYDSKQEKNKKEARVLPVFKDEEIVAK